MRLLICLFLSTALFAEWPQFRGNPALTGVADSGAPPAQLKLLWTWEGGEQFESSPIIAGGVVYIGSGAGDLLAIDLSTGKTKWKYKAGSEIGESTPTIANGIVYVGDLKGVLHAVNAGDGKGDERDSLRQVQRCEARGNGKGQDRVGKRDRIVR